MVQLHNQTREVILNIPVEDTLKRCIPESKPFTMHIHTPPQHTGERFLHCGPFLLKLHKNPGLRKLLQIPKQFSAIKISNSTMVVCTELFKCTPLRTFERPDCPQQVSVQPFTPPAKEISQSLWTDSFSVSSI